MGAIASHITSLTIVFSTVYLDTDQRKHQSSASLAFVWGIHRRPVNSPHKWPVTRKMFPFDDVIIAWSETYRDLSKVVKNQIQFSVRYHSEIIVTSWYAQNWPFVRRIFWSSVDFPSNGQARWGFNYFSIVELKCCWTNGLVADCFSRQCAHMASLNLYFYRKMRFLTHLSLNRTLIYIKFLSFERGFLSVNLRRFTGD